MFRKYFTRRYQRKLARHRAYFAAVLPPTPPPVLFEFAGLQQQLTTLNASLAALLAIEEKRQRHEVAQRGY